MNNYKTKNKQQRNGQIPLKPQTITDSRRNEKS